MAAARFLSTLSRWPRWAEGGPFLFFGSQLGLRPGGCFFSSYEDLPGGGPLPPGGRFPWVDRLEAPVAGQAAAIYEGIKGVLSEQGGGLGHLVRLHIYQRDKRLFPVFDRVRRHYEPSAPTPSSALGVSRLDPSGEARLALDAIALRPGAAGKLGGREALPIPGQPAAAHFSHIVAAGPYLFLAGQIPIDTSRPGAPLIRTYEDVPPEGRFLQVGRSHEDARNGPIAAQSWFTYDLVRKLLEGAGSSLGAVLNLTIYLQDMRDFPTFHRVHERFFPSDPPPLTIVQMGEVGHKGTLVEVEATALRPGWGLERKLLRVEGHPALGAQMSRGAEAGGLLFLSGMAGVDGAGEPVMGPRALPPAARRALARAPAAAQRPAGLQLAAILSQVEAILAPLGAGLDRLVHLTLFLEDIEEVVALEPLFRRAFPRRRPALAAVELPRPSPLPGARLSLTAIAWVGEERGRSGDAPPGSTPSRT